MAGNLRKNNISNELRLTQTGWYETAKRFIEVHLAGSVNVEYFVSVRTVLVEFLPDGERNACRPVLYKKNADLAGNRQRGRKNIAPIVNRYDTADEGVVLFHARGTDSADNVAILPIRLVRQTDNLDLACPVGNDQDRL